jgi:hypothetical protein
MSAINSSLNGLDDVPDQGCRMVCISHTKIPILVYFESLGMDNFGVFQGNVILLLLFGIFLAILVHFGSFWYILVPFSPFYFVTT